MASGPLAVVSDIHGNRWALEAVLGDIRARGVSRVVNLGDSLYGPLAPAETAAILAQLDWPTVCGNEDRLIFDPAARAAENATLQLVRASLSPENTRWLQSLPRTIPLFDDFRLCHGTPRRDDEYLLREITEGGWRLRPASRLTAELAGVTEPVVLCGHDHQPGVVAFSEHRLLVDPGSVGLQAYQDTTPLPHVVENGSPHARYSIVSRGDEGWRVDHLIVPYPWEIAARVAEQNGRPDWAFWLRWGRVTL